MSITLQKLQIRAAAAAAAEADDMGTHHSPTNYNPDEDVSTRIHKLERELADLPPNSPLRSNFQAILKDYRDKGEAGLGLMYQNGRSVGDYVNPDLRRGPVYVERCSICIVSDGEVY
ncbi:hypothetical protein TWF481_011922 [Arthrobotrys musiformis]|uniref:Uncharacterized protein n=1 Tax=Arthrobotrys musiformis TaxID=47236 RepID=A0AAV9VYB7_9PEZI